MISSVCERSGTKQQRKEKATGHEEIVNEDVTAEGKQAAGGGWTTK
jgi:hypothetical protein